MLPSCGHFKNIPCPFYKLALCVRPHCPYKHQNSENGNQRQIFAPIVDDTESLFEAKINLNTILNKSAYNTSVVDTQKATYIPTPVDPAPRPPGILKSSNSSIDRPSSSFIPEYKPTPISRLKEHCVTTVPVKSTKSEYIPEFPITLRKKKNVEEYDPTEVKCVPKKTVTFVDQIDLSSDVPVILISSDEDLDDSESAPKFSDDDLEDDTYSDPKPSKQVPEEKTVTVIKEEVIDDDIQIDEFSIVDKILVDCKKNERLLNSFQKSKLLPKTSDSTTKSASASQQDKNRTVQSQKSDGKIQKSDTNKEIKEEKNLETVSSAKDEEEAKREIIDLCSDISSERKSANKKEIKTEKSETSKEKVQKTFSSHSSQNKEKLKKDSKESDKSKHAKKTSAETKISSAAKSSKPNRHSSTDSQDIKHSKKQLSDNHKKQESSSSNSEKKKIKHEVSNTHLEKKKNKLEDSTNHFEKKKHKSDGTKSKISESNVASTKEKGVPAKISPNLKRKSDDCDRQPSKNKSAPDSKKIKSEHAKMPKPQNFDSEQKIKSESAKMPKPQNSDSEQKIKSESAKMPKPQNSDLEQRSTLLNNKSSDKSDDDDIDDSLIDEYFSSSDSDPNEECRRIFEECYGEDSLPPEEEKKEEELKQNRSKTPELVILRKKRLAHPAASELKVPKKVAKMDVKRPLPPAQVMYNRFAQSQAKYAQENKNVAKSGTDRKRLSFVPNESLLAALKNKANQGNPALSNFSPLPPTVSKTLKVTHRKAHIPEVAKKPRPIIPSGYGNKVPSNIRQKYLNAFIDECLKFCSSEDEAYSLALEEEKKAYDRVSSKALYMNVAANALNRLRRQAEEGPADSGSNNASSKNSSKMPNKTVSHEAVLNGPLAQRRSFSIGRKKEAPEIKGGAALYEYLLTYVLTPEQLKENSYPLPHPTERDRAVIEGVYANRANYCNDAFKRECCRCHKTYYVNVDGDYVRDEECDFHWGRIWKKRIAGNFESRYSCCQGDAESDGCCVSPGHVFEGSENHALRGFVKTLPKTPPRDNCYGIYALDCEMCYTTAGMELTRVTVVDTDSKTVYESFVKPKHKVLDYNTRFSGITEDDLKNVRTSIQDVQAVLLCIFNDKTILIGHSLESDFKALKLFHTMVIDTSVVFPHKNGLPFKRALKTLMAEKLNKIIQNDVGGHDSQEDAVACMELMLWKVKEDIRGNR